MVTSAELTAELATATRANTQAAAQIQARVDDILRPKGALARLDEIAVWLAAWQGTHQPMVNAPAALIFAGDHGVVAEGVSAYPAEVTGAMLAAFEAEQASISALARVAGATVTAIDVGVGRPTGNLRIEPAMDQARFDECFATGRNAVAQLDTDLLIVGEMGIGNTTAAAAVSAALVGSGASAFVGAGTGVDVDALRNKAAVVADSINRIQGVTDPLEILREVGGTELVAMAGALTEARMRSVPVLLDGYIATAPAVALHAIGDSFVANARAGHCSAEPGHRLVLDHLGLEPLLTLDMRLGEASGAMAAVPLTKMACALVTEVPTFAEFFAE